MRRGLAALLAASVAAVGGAAHARQTSAGAPAGWITYADTAGRYTIAHPPDWPVDAAYVYSALGPGREIAGVAFRVPAALARGTNLSSSGTQLSVETLPGSRCDVGAFLADPQDVHDIAADGVRWSVATVSDAGAGNFYDAVVWVLADRRPCLAVRYAIHSTNVDNYAPGTVRAFDRAALTATFDRIRRTLQVR